MIVPIHDEAEINLDLSSGGAGDGQLDVVQFEGDLSGYFERTTDFGWETFKPFSSLPNVAFGDPNVKFVDLTGDGHADLLIGVTGDFVPPCYLLMGLRGLETLEGEAKLAMAGSPWLCNAFGIVYGGSSLF